MHHVPSQTNGYLTKPMAEMFHQGTWRSEACQRLPAAYPAAVETQENTLIHGD
jgi:hypothetical protein